MDTYTVKELKKIIMNYKKSNCPAVSRARRDELLMMIKDLNINVDEREPLERKKREPKKERVKMRLPKADKIDISQFENMVEFPKNKKIEKTKDKNNKDNLIGGDDILRLVNDPNEFLENIKSMYPLGYDNLKNGLEKIVKKKLDEDKLLIMSKFLKKELKKPKFFNKTFLINMLKSKSQEQVQDIIASLFRLIDKKLLKKNIIIRDYNFIDTKYKK